MRQIMNEQLLITESNPIKARCYDYDRFFYPWHFHSQYELLYVRQSFGQCFVGDAVEPFAEGDLFLFGSHLPHYMRSDDSFRPGQSDYRVQGTIIQFEQNFMDYSIAHYPQFQQISQLLQESVRGIRFPHQDRDYFQQFPLLTGMEQICQLLQLLQRLAVQEDRKVLASPLYYKQFPVMGDKRIDKIISYLNSNYTHRLRLDDVASMASMNSAAFCRYFRQATGQTLLQYLQGMRVGYACQLLMVGSMEISQIALECGFESITQFNRCFKQEMKMTPSQYRERQQ